MVSRLNPVTSQPAAANGSRGTGSALDPVKVNGVNTIQNSVKQAPAKATAAPKGNTKETFTGLAEALNSWQRTLKEQKKIEVEDEYEIVFTPGMKESRLKRPGETDKRKTPLQTTDSARNKLPETNSVDVNSRGMQVAAGMPIVQFIDQVMRNSTYITGQQTMAINADGETEATGTSPTGQTAWYKITVEAQQLQYDNRRRDHAYKMKFVISPYAINTMQSEFFPNSRYRGSHKSYNYWFSGLNTEILNFEQDFNNLYRLIISGIGEDISKKTVTDFRGRDQYRKITAVNSEQSSQGNDGTIGEPGANAADFLYSPTDQAKIRLRILGDPAWMQQGEVSVGVSERTFNFNPFNPDGTINYDSQEVVFDVSWNRPVDYDLSKGIMDVTAKNIAGNLPRENATYTAIKCKNIFSKGRFEQELEGRLLIEYETNNKPVTNNREAQPTAPVNGSRLPTQNTGATLLKEYEKNLGLPSSMTNPVPVNRTINENTAQQFTTLPASNPQPATSNGDIRSATGNVAPATFSQAVQQGRDAQNTRLNRALAGQILNNQNIAKDQ